MLIQWKKTKLLVHQKDNIINTGMYKFMLFTILTTLIMNYPSQYGEFYQENANEFVEGKKFVTNDILLCLMLFLRFPFFFRTMLSISVYTDPRAQRVSAIYGIDADNGFAIKALMKDNPERVLMWGIAASLILLSYSIRLFEQQIQEQFRDITSAMWYVLITMTTVGYGDIFAKSHWGRVVAVITAFWGTCYVSLFVLSLLNLLKFDSSEEKAYNLMRRLKQKDDLRLYAGRKIIYSFRIYVARKQGKSLSYIQNLERLKKHASLDFRKKFRQIKNVGDSVANMDNLKNGVDSLLQDVALIRMAQFFIFKNFRKLRGKIIRQHPIKISSNQISFNKK